MSSDGFAGMVICLVFALLFLCASFTALVAGVVAIRKENGTAGFFTVVSGAFAVVFLIVAALNLDRWLCGVTVPW